jgi:phospholipid-binding lipoprotein MlaA
VSTGASRALITIWVVAILSGCATTGGEPQWDPIEPLNRGVFKFNRTADKFVLRPIAKGYQAITPSPIRRGVGNFFYNLAMPIVFVGDLLQAKPQAAGQDVVRFLVNSTAGIGGLFDVASRLDIDKNREDFGQTMAVWGVGSGPYVMVPFLGPYSLRDGVGAVLDFPFDPLYHYENSSVRDKVWIFKQIDLREGLIGADAALDNALDPYLALRDAYYQNRLGLIHDGDPPLDAEFSEEEFEEFNEEDFLDQ